MKRNKFGYKVDIGQRCENEIESNEEFGSWERSYSNWFEKISKTKDVPDVVSDFDIQPGETCYVVWVEYSSGDSFGMAENENVEAVGVFKDKECAIQLEKAIETYPWIIDHYDDESDETYKNLVIKLTPEQKEIWKTIQDQGLEPFRKQVENLFPKEES